MSFTKGVSFNYQSTYSSKEIILIITEKYASFWTFLYGKHYLVNCDGELVKFFNRTCVYTIMHVLIKEWTNDSLHLLHEAFRLIFNSKDVSNN